MQGNELTYVEAMVVKEGSIAFVGDQTEAKENYTDTRKIDLFGKTMLPRFIDVHSPFSIRLFFLILTFSTA
ncbi:MAG: hypothetical protein ACFB15_10735 [Cyclobacteriaceae bacterium]